MAPYIGAKWKPSGPPGIGTQGLLLMEVGGSALFAEIRSMRGNSMVNVLKPRYFGHMLAQPLIINAAPRNADKAKTH